MAELPNDRGDTGRARWHALCESKVTQQLQPGKSCVNGPEQRLGALVERQAQVVAVVVREAAPLKYYARGTIRSLLGLTLRDYLLNRK